MFISVTLWTAQPPMSWSKAKAVWNIIPMSVTLPTAQLLMSRLNVSALRNIEFIVVTPEGVPWRRCPR